MKNSRRKRIVSIVLIIVRALLLITVVPVLIFIIRSPGAVEPFLNEKGTVLQKSISEKTFVEINGIRQEMFIRGENIDNPILLFVHGGPGMPEYFMTQEYKTDLEKYFTVCYPEQRGAGISYSADICADSITTEQLVSDTSAIAKYLCERFEKKKVYLLGHSWGSYIAIQSAARNPELYYAYIGMSQISNTTKSEQLAYNYMIKRYTEMGNTKMVDKLKQFDIHNSKSDFNLYQRSSLRDECMHDLGVGTTHKMKSVISGIFLPVMNCTAYTVSEKINIWRAKSFLHNATVLDRELYSTDISKTFTKFDIPVYFMGGAYDYTVNYNLQKQYYNVIEAPVKAFYTFENSAHSPLFEEPEHFINIMLEDIVNGETNLED